MAPSSPVGIELGKDPSRPKWKVGKLIGAGACASVHFLETLSGEPTEFAIKLAPLPKKITKKKNSVAELNASSLYYESLVYQNHFPDMQGKIIPNLPSGKGPPSYGEVQGYRFLVIERMASLLSDVCTQLLKDSTASVSFGPIAVQLLECVQAVHEHNHIVLDVKPENFMLATASGNRKVLGTPKNLASRIRILDLGLVRPWRSAMGGSHRPNEGGKMAGTPLYVSLNVHNGETPSRRDDLESLGYVIAELLMQIAANGNATEKLPWNNGKSDDEIFGIKEAQVNDPNSSFYSRIGDKKVIQLFQQYMDEVRSYTYKECPDYDNLKEILLGMKVSITLAKKRPARRQPTKRAASSSVVNNRRSARSRQNNRSSQDEDSPSKVARVEIIDLSDSLEEDNIRDDETFEDALDETIYSDARQDDDSLSEMDWEPLPADENEEPINSKSNSKSNLGVTVVLTDGPHKGASAALVKGCTEAIIIGRNPQTKLDETALALPGDDDLDESHVRLELEASKKLIVVRVTDLKSAEGCFVGSEKIRSGKTVRVFRNQSIHIGQSTITVRSLDNSKAPKRDTNKAVKKPEGRTQRVTRSGKQYEAPHPEPTPETYIPRLARRGVQLEIKEGPHSGETFILESGGVESLTIGSKPSSSARIEKFVLRDDKTIDANHVRLELVATKRLTAVTVTDLKSGKGTMVNRNTLSKGKNTRAFMNDKIKIGDTVIAIKAL